MGRGRTDAGYVSTGHARRKPWPPSCVCCGSKRLKRGPGTYWRCSYCGTDGGRKEGADG